MDTETHDRAEALRVYSEVLFLAIRERRVGKRKEDGSLTTIRFISRGAVAILLKRIDPYFDVLNEAEKIAVSFILFYEKGLCNIRYHGPGMQLILDCFVRRFKTSDLSADFEYYQQYKRYILN